MDHARQLLEHGGFGPLHRVVIEHEVQQALAEILRRIEAQGMKARSPVMLKMIVEPPMQLSHLIAGLAMVRQMQQPVGAMALRRVDEEWRVEFGAGAVLNMPIEPVLNQVTPAFAMSHIHQGPDVLATQFDRQQRLGLGSFHR